MAQELAIAKAAFSASLFRADPTSLSRPQVESLFPLIDAAVTQCSRPNVQVRLNIHCLPFLVFLTTPPPFAQFRKADALNGGFVLLLPGRELK